MTPTTNPHAPPNTPANVKPIKPKSKHTINGIIMAYLLQLTMLLPFLMLILYLYHRSTIHYADLYLLLPIRIYRDVFYPLVGVNKYSELVLYCCKHIYLLLTFFFFDLLSISCLRICTQYIFFRYGITDNLTVNECPMSLPSKHF